MGLDEDTGLEWGCLILWLVNGQGRQLQELMVAPRLCPMDILMEVTPMPEVCRMVATVEHLWEQHQEQTLTLHR
ncbi:unnamed protein product [marine sediment metagenome]|uniref:Uncharacterized protein n=1 Tax=marine sediment metagenome TaxID=412755 RepID=X1QM46_9ZZZZ